MGSVAKSGGTNVSIPCLFSCLVWDAGGIAENLHRLIHIAVVKRERYNVLDLDRGFRALTDELFLDGSFTERSTGCQPVSG